MKDLLGAGSDVSKAQHDRFGTSAERIRDELESVYEAAKRLAANSSHVFSLEDCSGKGGSSMRATTVFDCYSQKKRTFELSLSLERTQGLLEGSVVISELHRGQNIVYRLDARQGEKVEEEMREFRGPSDSAIPNWLESFFEANYRRDDMGNVTEITDNYSETEIRTTDALGLIQNGRNHRLPKGRTGPTLKDFFDEMENQGKNSGLLGH